MKLSFALLAFVVVFAVHQTAYAAVDPCGGVGADFQSVTGQAAVPPQPGCIQGESAGVCPTPDVLYVLHNGGGIDPCGNQDITWAPVSGCMQGMAGVDSALLVLPLVGLVWLRRRKGGL